MKRVFFTDRIPFLSANKQRQSTEALTDINVRSMKCVPEIKAKNRLHFSGIAFWYICHANLGPDSSGTRLQCWL